MDGLPKGIDEEARNREGFQNGNDREYKRPKGSLYRVPIISVLESLGTPKAPVIPFLASLGALGLPMIPVEIHRRKRLRRACRQQTCLWSRLASAMWDSKRLCPRNP